VRKIQEEVSPKEHKRQHPLTTRETLHLPLIIRNGKSDAIFSFQVLYFCHWHLHRHKSLRRFDIFDEDTFIQGYFWDTRLTSWGRAGDLLPEEMSSKPKLLTEQHDGYNWEIFSKLKQEDKHHHGVFWKLNQSVITSLVSPQFLRHLFHKIFILELIASYYFVMVIITLWNVVVIAVKTKKQQHAYTSSLESWKLWSCSLEWLHDESVITISTERESKTSLVKRLSHVKFVITIFFT
jgi:hypothetical protein